LVTEENSNASTEVKEDKDEEYEFGSQYESVEIIDLTHRNLRDPIAPKRNKSAYLYFYSVKRDLVKQQNPGASLTQRSKILSAQWKSLSDTDKKAYTDLAATDKARYEMEKETYQQILTKKQEAWRRTTEGLPKMSNQDLKKYGHQLNSDYELEDSSENAIYEVAVLKLIIK